MLDIEKWEKECLTKKRYDNFFAADQKAKKRKEETGIDLHAYRCSSCEHWHLTKQPQSGNRYKILKVC